MSAIILDKKMEIEIQTYWGAKATCINADSSLNPEVMEHIVICDVAINGKFLGSVIYDGKNLKIDESLKE